MPKTEEILEEVEEAAGETLGMDRWDRPAIFREAADAATDADLPYWAVLILSGAIATLGLALDSSAVVIGAMLIAPLLAPVVGLALALATGDARLAVQVGFMVVASTAVVVATGALLTLALPYTTVTPEISARIRPTTLDLVIAIFSGLAGVVVTVARGHRLSAAIPGVAISVALIPPLGVAGFGFGSGLAGGLVGGSLLLYGANLAGIVLSGMLVFLLVGMHRENVLEAARQWHREERTTGLVARVDQLAWVRRLGVIRSTPARVGLVVAFVAVLAIPLSRSLQEITREVRVNRAVEHAQQAVFDVEGRSSVLHQRIARTGQGTQVFLRVATTGWFDDEARDDFERMASAEAGEPVRLVLEQLPATTGDLEQLASLLPREDPSPAVPPPPPPPAGVPHLLATIRERLEQAAGTLPLPDGTAIAGMELSINGEEGSTLRVGYAAPRPLPPEAEQILARQLARAVDDPAMGIRLVHISTLPRSLGADPTRERVAEILDLLQRYGDLRVELVARPDRSEELERRVAALVRAGIPADRIAARADTAAEPGLRLSVAPPAEENP